MRSGAIVVTDETGKEVVLYEPTPKQEEFHARTEANVLFWGGRGSGKSMALRWEAHARALAHPGFTYCILRRTYPELQRSHLVHISREMRQLGGSFHHTDRVAHYPNGSKGFFSHCAGEEDVLNLLSAEFAWMGFDELSTFEWDMFTKLSASVRVPVNSGLTAMVRGCTNPLGPSAEEVLHYFVERDVEPSQDPDYNPNDWFAVKANLEDNKYVDQAQYRKRFSGLAAHVRKAWVDGDFILENALFDVQPNRRFFRDDGTMETIPYHYLEELDIPELVRAGQVYRAYDHGYFPDPAVCLWIAHLGNRYVVFHEKLWFKTIASEIAAEMREETENLGVERVVTTYCDPSIDIHTGADVRTIKDIFENCGVPMDLSVNSRELYAAAIHTALAEEAGVNQPRLQIYQRGCPYLAKTLPKQRYDPKHPLRLANHKNDHAAVAMAYFLISSGSMEKGALPGGQQLRPWMKKKPGDLWVLGKENVH